VAYGAEVNAGKLAGLVEQARRLGRVRSQVWRRYGSVSGAGRSDRQVRDRWLADGTHTQFGVLANAWKETVRDAMGDVRACREAAKVNVRRAVSRRTTDPAERKRLFTLLKSDLWAKDPYLARLMRQHWRRGANRTHNQVVVRADNYRTFTLAEGGDVWLAKGYTEVLTDSDGQHHGPGLGGLLAGESDRLKVKNRHRAKLRAVAGKAAERGDLAKADRVVRNNLGTVKKTRAGKRFQQRARTVTFEAVHAVVDKASLIAVEDLTRTFTGRKNLGRNMNRRLAAWTKGLTAQALHSVSERRGSALVLVNAAYTSQVVPATGALGLRRGDRLHCESGAVWHADHAAAVNVLHRVGDPDITLHTPHTRVKQILQERTDRHRIRLPIPDSSPAQPDGERIIQPCSGVSNE
jgi:IS605 OrfB family transposase